MTPNPIASLCSWARKQPDCPVEDLLYQLKRSLLAKDVPDDVLQAIADSRGKSAKPGAPKVTTAADLQSKVDDVLSRPPTKEPRRARKPKAEVAAPAAGPDDLARELIDAAAATDNRARAPDHYIYTDAGNAEAFAKEHREAVRWVPDWKTWVQWDGARWRPVATEHLYPRAITTARGFRTAAGDPSLSRDEADALSEHGAASEHVARLDAMIKIARGLLAEEPSKFDADRFALNVTNGTIDLRTGVLHEHRRDDMITKLAPVAYDPSAVCPQWDAFLETILPDVAVREWVRLFLGYCATGAVTEQICTFFIGKGANGKSTLLGRVQNVLGDYAFQGPPGLLIAPHNGADDSLGRRQRCAVVGRRLVAVQEVEPGRYLNESQVKQLTGGDKVSAAELYQREKEWDATHKLVIGANHRPRVRGRDHAIWRRIKLVPFSVTIADDKKDLDLPGKLDGEAPGILAWLVRASMAWHKGGLPEVRAINLATADYQRCEDALGDFLEECVEINGGGWEPIAALYSAYKRWCDASGVKQPWTKRALGDALEEAGFVRDLRGVSNVRGHIGLRLRQPPAAEASVYR